MPLDADQLDAFWHVAQAGGFHAAAAQLHLSQPAVTQRVRALEADLGQALFVRTGRGVALTEAGRVLLRHCKGAREAEAGLRQALGAADGGLAGRLAIAAGTAEGLALVAPALAALGAAHPELDLVLDLADPMDPVATLEGGRVDAVVSEVPVRRAGLVATRLGEVSYVLAASPALAAGWPDDPPAALLLRHRAIDFDPTDRVTLDHLAACFPGEPLDGLRRHFVANTEAIARWALEGGGFAVLPETLVAPHVRAGRLRLLHPACRSVRALYWCVPAGPASPAARAALAAVRKRMRATDKPR